MRALLLKQTAAYQARGARILQAIDRAGLTQRELAKKIGVDEAYLSLVLQGKKPGVKHLKKIAAMCEVDYGSILDGGSPTTRRGAVPPVQPLSLTPALFSRLRRQATQGFEISGLLARRLVEEAVGGSGIRARVGRGDRVVVLVI